jgi:glyoxylate reductase
MEKSAPAMSKPRVFVARKLPGRVLDGLGDQVELTVWEEPLPPPREALLAQAARSEGLLTLITDRVDRELLMQSRSLRVVSNMGVGYDNIDVVACTERRIPVGNTPGVLTEATADLTFALLLAAARRLPESAAFIHSGEWKTWDPNLLLGQEVWRATLGIIGMGKIGQAVARRALGFQMRILYCGTPREQIERELKAERVEKERLLADSDFVSLHVPLSPKTRHLIGRSQLALMKPTAVLINTSRGPVVDQAALAEALRSGRPGAAALDVTDPEPISLDDPLLGMHNALIVPHIGSGTLQTRTRMAQMAVENLLAGLLAKRLPHCVNPQVYQ